MKITLTSLSLTATKERYIGVLGANFSQDEIEVMLSQGLVEYQEGTQGYVLSEAGVARFFNPDLWCGFDVETHDLFNRPYVVEKRDVHESNFYRGAIETARPYMPTFVYRMRFNDDSSQPNVIEFRFGVDHWGPVEVDTDTNYTGYIEFDNIDDLKAILESYLDSDKLPVWSEQSPLDWNGFVKELWKDLDEDLKQISNLPTI